MCLSKDTKSINRSPESSDDVVDTSTSSGEFESEGKPLHAYPTGHAGGPQHAVKGLNVLTAAVFIAGEMAGSGLLALPKSVENSGYMGLVLIVVVSGTSGYTGILLSRCWDILQEQYPKYRQNVRYPYPAIALEAYGRKARMMTSVCIHITMFGGSVVFLLIAASNIELLVVAIVSRDISFCYWIVIIAAALCPLAWLGTPKDFWMMAVGAISSTAIASVLLVIAMLLDVDNVPDRPIKHNPITFQSFCLAFGTMQFAFGAHPIIPTIQHDMRRPEKCSQAVFWGFFMVACLYLPVSSAGYFIYGHHLSDNILSTVHDVGSSAPSRALLYVVTVGITLHLICTFVIVLNPICQELEELFRVPHDFNWRRCCLRTLVMTASLFFALSIPHFGHILALVGGSTLTLLTFVFPPLYYMKLCRKHRSPSAAADSMALSNTPAISSWELLLNAEIVLVGFVGGVVATYAAVIGIAESATTFSAPCYISVNVTVQ